VTKTVRSKTRKTHSKTDGAALRKALDHEANALWPDVLREFKRLQASGRSSIPISKLPKTLQARFLRFHKLADEFIASRRGRKNGGAR
jgi:hypothetical protein